MFGFRARVSSSFRNAVAKARGIIDHRIEASVKKVVEEMHSDIHSVTPVWSGRTLANFQWGNTPYSGSIEPVRDGKPGEHRRAAAAQVSTQSLQGLDYGSLIYLVNNARYPDGSRYIDMEFGKLPTPSTSRVPAQGIMRLAKAKHPSRKVVTRLDF